MKFAVITKDFSGLGWAIMLQREGHEVVIGYENKDLEEEPPERQDGYLLVGNGLVAKEPMEQLFGRRSKLKDVYWIFDSNNLWEYGEKLRKEGFKVWGASELTHKMEHDRDYGVAIAKKYGFDLPLTKTFTNIDEAVTFLEQNEDTSYVCKPNDADSYLTYVPQSEVAESANRELRAYLRSMNDGTEFILQEVVKGVEAIPECFFYKGEPYFAWVEVECKRKNSGDKGELTGSSQGIGFLVDLDAPIIKNTVAKLFPFYKELRYTGFADVDVIIKDNRFYFIEFCNRFGYDAHANLFLNLLITPFGECLANMIDGKLAGFYDRFRKGFGAAIRMYLDNIRTGFPLYVSKDVEHKFFHYEAYQEDVEHPETDFQLSGYGYEIGIICGHGWTLKDAAKSALDNALKVNFPLCSYREDLDEENYPSSPIKRWNALNAMGLI
jgi:phosphoribosylamine-glycine ligase